MICTNIFSNAGKYAGDSPTVEVSYRKCPGRLTHEFRFRDHGPGVPDDHKSLIFFPFASKKLDGITGQGLGLSVCRRVLTYYGGSINVQDSDPHGAIFVVRIPKLI